MTRTRQTISEIADEMIAEGIAKRLARKLFNLNYKVGRWMDKGELTSYLQIAVSAGMK